MVSPSSVASAVASDGRGHALQRVSEGVIGALLRRHGGQVAVADDQCSLTYDELADRVIDRASGLPTRATGRRLIGVRASNTTEFLVDYLAAIEAGHVVLLLPDTLAAKDALLQSWSPDLVIGDGRPLPRQARQRAATHQLHSDLQLLMSTSGSTGSPKLVRLSQSAVVANARAIVDYLGIVSSDRAITTLPPYYCYGLSVIHSHLLAGASLVLNERSVSDPAFWDAASELGVTTFAGVPHTYEMVARLGYEIFDRVPTLRYLTQAGGRLPADKVIELAAQLATRGAELVVMYGQTEATARMGYLPPHVVRDHPGAVGVAIPGGSFRIDTRPGSAKSDPGELVFRGLNVMMGYARTPSDLARGAELDELRTGDLARWTEHRLIEIVGRLGREVKIFGQRIDLGRIENGLSAHNITAWCVGEPDRLAVVVADPAPGSAAAHDKDRPENDDLAVVELAAQLSSLSTSAIELYRVAEPPRTPAGKVDHAALRALATDRRSQVHSHSTQQAPDGSPSGLVAHALRLEQVPPASSFVDLGGDSLTYVVLSTKMEALIGDLPRDWHLMPLAKLDELAERSTGPHETHTGRRVGKLWAGWAKVDIGIVLRALFILTVVASHARAVTIIGGAHILVALAGHSMARFRLHAHDPRERALGVVRTAGRIIIPAVVYLALVTPITSRYHWYNVILGANVFGPRSWWADRWWNPWQMWFVEAIAYALLLSAALMAVPAVTRLDRTYPLALPALVVGLGALVRFRVIDLGGGPQVWLSAPAVIWLFGLGWAIARSHTMWQRLACTAAIVVMTPNWFGDPPREAVIIAGVCALIWIPSVRLPRWLTRIITPLAAASLFIYLTHFLVYPPIRDAGWPWTSVAASVAVGLASWWLWELLIRTISTRITVAKIATAHKLSTPAG